MARLQVLLYDELLPDLGDFREVAPCFGVGLLSLEELAHVVVGGTELVALRTMLSALKENACRQLFKSLLVSFVVALSQEESTESLVESGSVLLLVVLSDERLVVSLT